MKTRVCHVFSDVDQSHLIKSIGEVMDKERYDIGFVFLGKFRPKLYDFFSERGYSVKFIEFCNKKELPKAIYQMIRVMREWRPDIVHTHLLEGSFVGLIAAALSGVKRRVQTRHHGAEAHVYYPHGVWYDRFNNWMSSRIVAISPVVAETLVNRDGVPANKVVTIPHGFHLENLKSDSSTVDQLRTEYSLDGRYPIIGCISRYIHWKGVHNTITAFRSILDYHPDAKLVLANASGPYSKEIKDLLTATIPLESYVEIPFESRINSLYATFNIFVHVPIDRDLEAFGMVYIEPLALGVPSVFTLSGIASVFIENRKNAMVVPYNDPQAICQAVREVLANEELRQGIIVNGKADVWRRFGAHHMASQLDSLYAGL